MSRYWGRILACACTIYKYYQISVSVTIPKKITSSTQSCLVLYPFCASLLGSLIIWLMLLSLSSHNQYLRIIYIRFKVIGLYGVLLLLLLLLCVCVCVCVCAEIIRDSISLKRFLIRCHVHVFLSEISPICRLKYPYSCFFFPFLFPCYCSV